MEFDYENWLLNALYGCAGELGIECKIEISSERSFAMPEDKSTLLFIVKRLSGSVLFDSIKVQPVQIICYTEMATMDKGMQILDLFTKLYNNNQFTENDILIKQTYDTVVSLKPFVATENSFRASLYTYGTVTLMEGLADIEDFSWWNDELEADSNGEKWEKLKPVSIVLAYSCVPNIQKSTTSNLSTTEPQEASLSITLGILQRKTDFCKLVNMIGTGQLPQQKFKFKFKLQGYDIIHEAIMTTHGLNYSTTDAPALSLVFQV